MTDPWPQVPLGNLLERVQRRELVEPNKTYDILGAHWYAKGLYTKDVKPGIQIRAKYLYRVERGDFVYNRLFGWKGSFAIASEENDGCYVSNEFPCFLVNRERLDSQYLWYYFSRSSVWNAALGLSSGGTPTSRNRLKEDKLLAMRIPLPPLAEQRRIVARIEELAAKVEAARALREEAIELEDKLMGSAEREIWPDSSLHDAPSLSSVTTHLARGRQSRQGSSNHYLVKTRHVQMGEYVRSEMTLDSEVAAKVKPEALLRQSDVLIACSAAGCLGRVAFYDDTERTASTDTHVAIARASKEVILPEYLYAYLRGAQGQFQLRSRERGDWKREKVGFRLTELNLSDLKRVPVPLPSLSEQRHIVAYLDDLQAKVNAVKQRQAATAKALDALLPSILDQAFKGEL
jgi:type I restriction enzyme S subunit